MTELTSRPELGQITAFDSTGCGYIDLMGILEIYRDKFIVRGVEVPQDAEEAQKVYLAVRQLCNL